MRPLITLTTDFGTKDPYVASLKGVLLSRTPDATIVDITHDIPPFEPSYALPVLVDVLPYFPRESFHLVIIDPGVGSTRKALIGECPYGTLFLPDNGLPSLLHNWMDVTYRLVDASFIPEGFASPTFQARDLFAPLLASIVLGTPRENVGKPIPVSDLHPGLAIPPAGYLRIWNIDRFGNVLFGYRSISVPDSVEMLLEDIEIPFVKRYQDVPPGFAGMLVNSSEWLELFCREGSAADRFSLSRGMTLPVRISGGKGRLF
jgi:S-adenosylmethionine hydrolase